MTRKGGKDLLKGEGAPEEDFIKAEEKELAENAMVRIQRFGASKCSLHSEWGVGRRLEKEVQVRFVISSDRNDA